MKLRYNPKCVVASGLVVGGYWLLAPSDRRVSVALGLAIATYAGLIRQRQPGPGDPMGLRGCTPRAKLPPQSDRVDFSGGPRRARAAEARL